MNIQPVQIWKNGSLKEAAWLTCHAVSDNLKDSANFYYALYSVEDGLPHSMLADGNLAMGGDDYQGWQTNEYAWNWVVNQLGLVIAA